MTLNISAIFTLTHEFIFFSTILLFPRLDRYTGLLTTVRMPVVLLTLKVSPCG